MTDPAFGLYFGFPNNFNKIELNSSVTYHYDSDFFILSLEFYLIGDFNRELTSVKRCQKVGLGWGDGDYKKRISKTKNPKQ